MDIFKTGMGLSKTIKNVSRFREILAVFARNGFDEIIRKYGMDSYIPNFVIPRSRFENLDVESDAEFWKSFGYRLRKSCEELGPSFVKFGQLLATREDILPAPIVEELKQLQNNAKGITFAEAVSVIEDNLQSNYKNTFAEINENPIGTASIGVVYKAKLNTGEDVVIKVRRPNIRQKIETDFQIISFLVSKIEKASDDLKYLGLSRVVDDFFSSIESELNYHIEASNAKKMKGILDEMDTDKVFHVPHIYSDFSSENMIVMEFFRGIPFNEIKTLDQDLEKKMILGVGQFIRTLLSHGFFHADLHGGNFLHLESNEIGIIDFGLIGNLSKSSRLNLIAILYALVNNNFENLVCEFLDVAEFEKIPNYDILTNDLKKNLSPYLGLSVQETDMNLLVQSMVSTLSKHEVYLPREWYVIFRALITLDGVGKSLDIDFNVYDLINRELPRISQDLFSKEALTEEGIWMARDVLGSLKYVPRHLKWFLKDLSNKGYSFDINLLGLKNEISKINQSIQFLGLIFIVCTMLYIGASFIDSSQVTSFSDIPVISLIFWSLSFLIFIRSMILVRGKS